MINKLKPMAIFAEVIQKGSFSAAAKALDLSPSVVSYHIKALESQVGTALIYRSTRKLSLTSQGEIFYNQIELMLTMARKSLDLVSTDIIDPVGKLSVTLSSSLARSPINKVLAAFSLAYPKVEINLSYSDDRINIIDKSIDLAIRVGNLEDSSYKAKKIGLIQRSLVCSSKYLEEIRLPKKIEDIETSNWIALEQLPKYRDFNHINLGSYRVNFNNYITVNSVEAMSHLCELGLGFATLAEFQVVDLIKKGKLVRILPDWNVDSIPLYALWPNNVYENSHVKRLLALITKVL